MGLIKLMFFCCFSFFLFHVQLRRHPPVKWLIFLLLFFLFFHSSFFPLFQSPIWFIPFTALTLRKMHLVWQTKHFSCVFFPFLSLCFLASVVNCYLVRRNYSFYAVFHCFVCFLLRFSFFLLSRDCRLFGVLFCATDSKLSAAPVSNKITNFSNLSNWTNLHRKNRDHSSKTSTLWQQGLVYGTLPTQREPRDWKRDPREGSLSPAWSTNQPGTRERAQTSPQCLSFIPRRPPFVNIYSEPSNLCWGAQWVHFLLIFNFIFLFLYPFILFSLCFIFW